MASSSSNSFASTATAISCSAALLTRALRIEGAAATVRIDDMALMPIERLWLTRCQLLADSVAKVFFAAGDSNSPNRGRDDRIIMWGTTRPCAKRTGDSGNGFEAALICDCRLFRPLAENQPRGFLGLLQHYRHRTDVSITPRDVSFEEKKRQTEPRMIQTGS